MKLKQLMDFEMDKNKKSSLQVKAVKALAGFLILMFLLTILSRAADSLTIAKVTASAATGGVISHNIEVDGNITPNKDIAISTSANIKIASVEATEGKTVKKGDLLIQLDTADLKKKLLQAQKELQVAKATASDKKANEAIAADTKSKSLQRTYEDYNQTVADANDSVSKAKSDMNEAWNAYNTYKNSNSNSGETDTTVSDSLEKTVEEKQLAYDKAVANLDGVEKVIEEDVQREIEIEKAKVDEHNNPVTLTPEGEQKIREQVNARPENVSLLQNANDQINTAKDALTEAENALSAYNEQQNNSSSASYDEQLKTLYDDYKAKEEAYNEAVKQRQSTIQSANRTLEDAKAPENVDTATALTENDDLEEKQLAVDELQKVMDVNGKITGLFSSSNPAPIGTDTAIAQTVLAFDAMSQSKTGALVVFERNSSLAEHMNTGTIIDADVSSELLRNIFFEPAPLHDGAVIIRDGRIAAAGCMLPLSNNNTLSHDLGMRHRAGVGMSENSDAVVVIVSEETGTISVAVQGMLKRHLASRTLEKLLHNELCPAAADQNESPVVRLRQKLQRKGNREDEE